MKTSNYLIALATLTSFTLVGCSDNDFLGTGSAPETQQGEPQISFSASSGKITRAYEGAQAAAKLNNQFVVYGFKSSAVFAKGASAGVQGTYTGASDVFKNYKVNWVGTENLTESNTNGWEYVGTGDDYTSDPIGETGVEQSIKYWDYTAAEYDFLAWSIQTKFGNKAVLEAIPTDNANPYKPHSLKFQVPAANVLSGVYVANQQTVTADRTAVGTSANTYGSNVLFTFRNMSAKVRIGIYETIPGYSVKDVKFYTADATLGDATPTIFASTSAFPTAGTVNATFYDGTIGNVNDVVIATVASETDSKTGFGTFVGTNAGEYKETGTTYIGRASNQATMSSGEEDGWTYKFPMAATELNLKVDYTLVSKDGSGESIKVTGANAKIPANYGEWKANYAYTYLFKISDNTNGQTGPSTSPAGLYPITFDACVVEVENGNTQETITTVASPAITTYQNGSKITKENEYHASTEKCIYITADGIDLTTENTKLYTAIDLGRDKEGISEMTVANYANNDIILSDASSELADETTAIPADQTIDNVAITLSKKAVKFYPTANTIYVAEITNAAAKYYKVIKVEDISSATATYTLALKEAGTGTIAEGGNTIITVVDANGYKVTGAKNMFTDADDFTISESAEGEYTLVAKAGTVTGTKNIKLNGSTALGITVNAYEFAAASVTVDEGSNKTITLNLGGGAAADVAAASNFDVEGTGLSIASVAAGVVTIAAADGAENGKITFKNGGVEVASANINVNHYSLAVKTGNYAIINGSGSTTTLILKLGDAVAGNGTTLSTSASGVATVANVSGVSGEAVVTYVGPGTATISKGSASQTIEATNFAVTLYTDAACTAGNEVGSSVNLQVGTSYYAKFTNNGTAENVSLTATGCAIAKKADAGVYQVTVSAAGTATIKYTYKGVQFTLASKTVVPDPEP